MKKTTLVIYKTGLLILVLIGIGNLGLIFFSDKGKYAVKVAPTEKSGNTVVIRDYTDSKVETAGITILKEPTWFQKTIWPSYSSYVSDFTGLVFQLIIGIYILLIIRDFAEKDAFRDNVPIYLRRIGLAFVVLYFVNISRRTMIRKDVLSMTDHEFRLDERISAGHQIWIGVLLLALALASKRIVELQREQDMTI